MFGGGRKASDCPIGIDVGNHTVRMIQLTRDGDRYVALAAASRRLDSAFNLESPDGYHHAVGHVVRDMLASGKFQGRHAVSCLPAACLQYKNIRLPKMPYDELASAVKWEASERLKLSGDAMNIQFFDAGEVYQGQEARQEVILMAAPNRFIDDHVHSLSSCDLELLAIDVVPAALARCTSLPDSKDEGDVPVNVVIDVGYSGSKVLITQGQRICFFKLIEIGGRHMDEALASKLDLPMAAAAEARRSWMSGEAGSDTGARVTAALSPVVDDLTREINLCLRYYGVTFRGRRPEEVLVVGGESSSAWLWARICDEAGLKPSAKDPLASIDMTPVHDTVGGPDQWASWTVAVGLSLRNVNLSKRKSRGAA